MFRNKYYKYYKIIIFWHIVPLLLFLLCFPSIAAIKSFPIAWQGIRISYGDSVSPALTTLNGRGGAIGYQLSPQKLNWKYLSIYLDASISYWHAKSTASTKYTTNKTVVIGALAPVLRFPLMQNSNVVPYLEASAGPAIMSHDGLGCKVIGSRFTFQDMLGAGLRLGSRHKFDLSWHFLHYSNGTLAEPNNGMDIPIFITISYIF